MVQVEAHQLDPGLKALGCQPVESYIPFQSSGLKWVNLHPYTWVGESEWSEEDDGSSLGGCSPKSTPRRKHHQQQVQQQQQQSLSSVLVQQQQMKGSWLLRAHTQPSRLATQSPPAVLGVRTGVVVRRCRLNTSG